MPVLGYTLRRREPVEGPVLTPGEHNQWDYVQLASGGLDVEDPGIRPQAQILCRPSRQWIAFFGSGLEAYWSEQDFLMGHERIPFGQNTPRGRLEQLDDRRNIAIPPRISYGSLVPEMDGVSPNGLD